MIILIESLIGIVLFTIIIVTLTLKAPLISVGDYPPAIRKKCIERGLIAERKQRFTRADLTRKGIAVAVFAWMEAALDACEIHGHRGHVETEQNGFARQKNEN